MLYRLESSYIELLAPDPEATTATAWTGSLGRYLNERGDGLFSVALQTRDVAETVRRARERGLPVEDPLDGEGHDLTTGAVRRWTNARIPPEATRGTRCFFIQHRSPADALPPAPVSGRFESAALDVVAIGAVSAEIDAARAMWREVFGLAESRLDGMQDVWRYDLGNASLLLQAAATPDDPPDRWSVLALRVHSLNDCVERLTQMRLHSEHRDLFGLRGVLVEACGARMYLAEGGPLPLQGRL